MRTKRIILKLIIGFGVVSAGVVFGSGNALAFEPGRIIDDPIFVNKDSMSAAAIQGFLNARVPTCDPNHAPGSGARGSTPPWTCLKDYKENIDTGANNLNGSPVPDGSISAAQIIYNYAQQYDINPQVLIVTLQKENGLITDSWPYPWQYRTAMGFACPDGGSCDPAYFGFSKQVMQAARHFRNFFNENPNWTVPYKVGTRFVRYHPNSACGGTNVNIVTHGTAALYSYTPYQPNAASLAAGYSTGDGCSSYGNRNFFNYFRDWFGNPIGACPGLNLTGVRSGPQLMAYRNSSGGSNLTYTQLNNTGSGCVEFHSLTQNFSSWITHRATAINASDPAIGMLLPSKSAVDGQNSLNHMIYNGASGRVEVHRLSPDFKKYPGYYDVPTDLSGINPTIGTFVAGDFFGRGYDQMINVLYNGAAGRVELHMFNPSMTKAIGYYDIQTDLTGIDPSVGTFVAGDFFGRGYDQLALILYHGGNGRAEIHVFNPTLTKAIGYYDAPTDLAITSPTAGTFVAGDFLGRGYDQLVYAIHQGGGGRVETHMFNPSLNKAIGFQDIITGMGGFDATQ